MILKKNRMPHVQSRMINMQHITEAEAAPGQEVAATRIPPGAVITASHLEVVEGFSAGTISTAFVNGDGVTADVELVPALTDATSPGFTVVSSNLPLRAPQGGWIVFKPVGNDVAQAGGDIISSVEYVVDGRWTEVMPEASLAPDDVAA